MLPWARLAAVALAVAGLTWSVLHYFNPAQVGGVSAPGGGNVFSLSSGLALAAVIVWGPQTLLAVWLGSLVGGQLLGFSLLDSLAAPLGAAMGAWLVRRHPDFDARLPDLSDLLRLLAAGALGALASAAVGSTALLVRNAIGPDALWQNLRDGWMGDLLGVLLLTPLALLWWSASGRPWLAEVRKKWPECLLLAGLLLWVTGEVFLGWGLLQRLGWSESLLASITRADWLFPLIALVAVRLGRRATALALLLMALAGYAGTYQGLGVLATNGSSRLLSFWFFFMNLSLLGLLLAWHVHASQRLRQQLMQHSASANKELLNIHKALNLHTAVAILDARGHFSSVNAVFCRTCGYPADELIGRLPQTVLAADDSDAALYQQVTRQMQAGQDWEGEFANRAKDGHRFWWATSISPILGDDGHPAMFVVLATDISARQLSEQLVRDYQQDLEAQVRHKTEYLQQAIDTLFISEARYRFLLDESSDPIFSFSPDIRYTYANAAFASPIGKTPQQVIGCTPHEVMPAVDADKRVSGVRSVFERGQEIVSEVRVSTATGERYYLTTAKPVVNLLQQVVMVLCVSKDITHIRQTRAELQSALNLLGATLEATEQGIIVMDTHDKLKLWNRRFLDLWGLQPEWLQMDDLVLVRQQMASLLIDPGQMAHLAHLADAGAATDRFATVLLRFTDGRVIKRSSQPQKLGEQVVGRVWSYTDITELEQQKEALRDSETRFSLAVDGADQGIWDINLSTGEMYHSPRMAGMLGYTQAELPPLLAAWEARIAPDMAAGFRATFNAHLKNPVLPFEYVLPLRHRDGSVRSIQSRGRASLDAAGRAVRVTGTHTDTTERLQAEQRLNETLALLNTTLAATDEGIIVVSTQDHLDLWNQRFLSLWGIDEALLQCQDIVAIRQQMATRTNDPLTYTASLTALYQQPQASTFDLLKMADGRVLRRVSHPQRMGGAVTGRVWSYADVTDLKRAEDSARAADQGVQLGGARLQRQFAGLDLGEVKNVIQDAQQVLCRALHHLKHAPLPVA